MAKLPRSMRSDPAAFRGQYDGPPVLDPLARMIEGHEVAVEVRRSEAGAYEIPGAAEPEDWHAVRTALDPRDVQDFGALKGWGSWERVVWVEDSDGFAHWYFLGHEWPEESR